jgi:hypothetical protein
MFFVYFIMPQDLNDGPLLSSSLSFLSQIQKYRSSKNYLVIKLFLIVVGLRDLQIDHDRKFALGYVKR